MKTALAFWFTLLLLTMGACVYEHSEIVALAQEVKNDEQAYEDYSVNVGDLNVVLGGKVAALECENRGGVFHKQEVWTVGGQGVLRAMYCTKANQDYLYDEGEWKMSRSWVSL